MSYFEKNNSRMEELYSMREFCLGQRLVADICLLSSEGRELGHLDALTSLTSTGLGASAGAVHEEHGVEVLPEYQP